ncbi:putative nuclease HARBI1 [Folsomia candida]|uniref:Putative nuclease HARBI1 n=1 Tax=Folsomia candida TaxID=158441 RepID=A0A226DIU7_FOLCA|nr:putative nuclease HARBI1 [Folsomia candida]
MPIISRKRKLMEEICEAAFIDIINSPTQADIIFDNAIDDVLTISTYRLSVPRLFVPKSDDWFRRILPNYSDDYFKKFMRVSRKDFTLILRMIENSNVFKSNSRQQLKVDQQLAITLHKLGHDGTGSGVSTTAALFGVGGGGTILKVVTRVLKAILELEKDWIRWPDETERLEIARNMVDQLPNCIGYIYGSHINLEEAPLDDPESYFTRKQRYAIQLQAVCDNNKMIRSIFFGYPGSVHDAEGQWIAGDSAYKNTDYMITPFKNNASTGTTAERRRFNKYFSGFRVKIECCFGIIKETFESLKELRIRVDRSNGHTLACSWIRGCIILYNILKDSFTESEEINIEVDDDAQEGNHDQGDDYKRNALFQFVNGKLNMM